MLGTGDRKVLTLSHRAQVKRFIADVLKVLKTQPGKQLAVSDLPATFGELVDPLDLVFRAISDEPDSPPGIQYHQ